MISMVLNIITGNHFSQKKLYKETNNFFKTIKRNSLITDNDCNYIVRIGKNSVKIVTSNQFNKNDISKIIEYINTLFKNQSILIDSSEKISWINDIKEVKINSLINNVQ